MLKSIRPYELSICSLQDDLMAVLRGINLEHKGQLFDPELELKGDGTQELSFSIPMYYWDKDKLIENPLWYNYQNGIIITGLRKARLIFNKGTSKQKIFDFIITEVKESHSSGQLTCEVKAEGAAFQELGKIGYKISLGQEDIENDYEEWEKGFSEWEGEGEYPIQKPIATINYWCDKVFEHIPGWTYRVEMDWSEYGDVSSGRFPDIIYEDEYVSSWSLNPSTNLYEAKTVESTKEKARIISVKNSNVYNITQTIAEKFEVFCRYDYIYDENNHVIGKECVFYNTYIDDKIDLDIFYSYNTSDITRTLDTKDLITKMYVNQISDEDALTGYFSIANAEANFSKEDYLLNFDYAYKVGAINKEQYEEIPIYEKNIRELNLALEELDEEYFTYSNQYEEKRIEYGLAKNELPAAQTVLNDAIRNKENSIPQGEEGLEKGVYHKKGYKSLLVAEAGGTYRLNLGSEGGIFCDELHPIVIKENKDFDLSAKSITISSVSEETCTVKEYGIVTLNKISLGNDWESSNFCYVSYYFRPTIKYDKTIDEYSALVDQYVAIIDKYQDKFDEEGNLISKGELSLLSEKMEEIDSSRKILITKKQETIDDFNAMMGAALKEGNWTDSDYVNYGETCEYYIPSCGNTNYTANNYLSSLIKENSTIKEKRIKLFWDDEPFDGEQLNYYEYGITKEKKPYVAFKVPYSVINKPDGTGLLQNLNTVYFGYSSGPKYTKETYIANKITMTQEVVDYASGTIVNVWLYNGKSYDTYEAAALKASQDFEASKDLNVFPDYKLYYGSQLTFGYQLINGTIELIGIIKDETITYDDLYRYAGQNRAPYLAYSKLSNEEDLSELFSSSVTSQVIIGDLDDYSKDYFNNYMGQKLWIEDSINPELSQESDYFKSFRYLRIKSEERQLKHNEDDIKLYYYDGNSYSELKKYIDYTLLNRKGYYYITPKYTSLWNLFPSNIIQKFYGSLKFANAETSVYLDALKVLKTNSEPTVSYSVTIEDVDEELIAEHYNWLGMLVKINDPQLHFEGVEGYIEEVKLQLDKPWEDSFVVENYKTEFEKIFSNIVASTESMRENKHLYGVAAGAFDSSGSIKEDSLQSSINKNDLQYSFDSGKLTMTELEGLVAEVEDGAVSLRGSGIYCATDKNEIGDWNWNRVLASNGIDAGAIKIGQIDTDQIILYAKQNPAFQLNNSGLYAYRKYSEIPVSNEYVVHNGDGLFFTQNDVDRVEISWNGLILRNIDDERVFYADTEGNLTLTGAVNAASGNIGDWIISDGGLVSENGRIGLNPSNSSNDAIWVRGANGDAFTVDKDGLMTATSAVFTNTVSANELTIKGIPVSTILDQIETKPGIFATSLLGEVFKNGADGETFPSALKYIIGINKIELDESTLAVEVNETENELNWHPFGEKKHNLGYWEPHELQEGEQYSVWSAQGRYNENEIVSYYGRYYKNIVKGTTLIGVAPYDIILTEAIQDVVTLKDLTFTLKYGILMQRENIRIRFKAKDTDGNTYYSSSFALISVSDGYAYSVQIESTQGVMFRNKTGSTTLTARLYANGNEIDSDGLSGDFSYKWTWIKNGEVVTFNGKSMNVLISDLDEFSRTYKCEIIKID